MSSISHNGDSISYTYDPDGIRTSKKVSGTVTKFHIMNGTLLGQTRGSDKIIFLYDEKGNKYGFDYNGTKYYYIFNIQGDVIGILNQSGTQIVSYQYDPWGKVLSVSGSEAATIGQLNPIRYRGYYYDTETGFYYLQSRYYDPTTRRFLNSDILVGNVGNVGQNNLFQYCSNNPVNLADPTGYLVGEIAVCLLFVAVVASIPAVIGAGASTALPSIDIPWEWPAIEPPARPETFSRRRQRNMFPIFLILSLLAERLPQNKSRRLQTIGVIPKVLRIIMPLLLIMRFLLLHHKH